MKCYDEAEAHNKPCKACDCKHWIDYKQEQNCSVLSIRYNGAMTLQQIAERLGVSHVRVKQIEDKAKDKIKKRKAREFSNFQD